MINILDNYADEPKLAEALKLSPRTLYRYRNLPDGLPYTELGGRIYYHLDTARRWIEEQRTHRPNPRPKGRGK
jgi:hypothetical protein